MNINVVCIFFFVVFICFKTTTFWIIHFGWIIMNSSEYLGFITIIIIHCKLPNTFMFYLFHAMINCENYHATSWSSKLTFNCYFVINLKCHISTSFNGKNTVNWRFRRILEMFSYLTYYCKLNVSNSVIVLLYLVRLYVYNPSL